MDFGFRGTASLGDFVWHDLNSDGVQQVNEPGLSNVTIQLTWFGSDGLPGNDDFVFTTATDSTGHYLFRNLPAGNYKVDVLTSTLPRNATQTYDLDGLSSPNSATTTLTAGQNRTDVDYGYNGNATIGDRVWYDLNGDGIQDNSAATGFEPGIVGATVTLTFSGADGDLATTSDNVTYVTTTGADGKYLFTNLFGGDLSGVKPNYRVTVTPPVGFPTQTFDSTAPTNDNQSTLQLGNNQTNLLQDFGYRGPATQGLGDFVWNDLDGNGRQDVNEPGIPNVTVQLWAAGPDGSSNTADDVQLATTTTDGNGKYAFPNLAASSVFGQYQVRVTQPTGYFYTKQNSPVAAGTTDSDVAVSGTYAGRTAGITLAASTFDNSWDAGLYRPSCLAGYVWWDTDNDGNREYGAMSTGGNGEVGIRNVTVRLTGTDDLGSAVNLTTTTDATGAYKFSNLRQGTYTLTETQPATFVDGKDRAGSLGGNATVNDVVSGINVQPGQNGTEYNFGEIGTSVSSSVSVTRCGMRYYPATKTYTETITVKNTSTTPVPRGTMFVIRGLPANVKLWGPGTVGCTATGSPYVIYDGGSLAPGASFNVPLQFYQPSGAIAYFNYTVDVYSGSF